ncbi:MAG: hypothetical protein ACT4P3_11855 [Betaproteobacteria bacterium]
MTMASVAGGCQHCQAHGAFTLHLMGADPERIRDLWTLEQSTEFSEAEKAALRLARHGALAVLLAGVPAYLVAIGLVRRRPA